MIKSIEQFIEAIREGSEKWHPKEPRWFRGERRSFDTPMMPSLYRGAGDRENELLQMFRARGVSYSDVVPHRDHTDQWPFLAQHVGLPTRLLDWSEGALIALHVALQKAVVKEEKETPPVVWMLNPLELNALSYETPTPQPDELPRQFPLPWFEPPGGCNPAFRNIRGAWENNKPGVKLPVAVYPTYVHPRLRGQRACFPVHGKRKEGLGAMVTDSGILQPLELDLGSRELDASGVEAVGHHRRGIIPGPRWSGR